MKQNSAEYQVQQENKITIKWVLTAVSIPLRKNQLTILREKTKILCYSFRQITGWLRLYQVVGADEAFLSSKSTLPPHLELVSLDLGQLLLKGLAFLALQPCPRLGLRSQLFRIKSGQAETFSSMFPKNRQQLTHGAEYMVGVHLSNIRLWFHRIMKPEPQKWKPLHFGK